LQVNKRSRQFSIYFHGLVDIDAAQQHVARIKRTAGTKAALERFDAATRTQV
jgi:hypothetical protein